MPSKGINNGSRLTFTRDDFDRAWGEDPPAEPCGPAPPIILVRRTSPDDLRHRQVQITIDDQVRGEIAPGGVFSCSVQPGNHMIRVVSRPFSESLDIEARLGYHIDVQCGLRPFRPRWLVRLLPAALQGRLWVAHE